MKSYSCAAWSACIVAGLSACGGSGGGSSTTPATTATPATPVVTSPTTTPPAGDTTFPLRLAYGGRLIAGFDDTYTVSGSCTGTARSTATQAQTTVFEGVTAFAQQLVASVHFTNCTPADSVDPGVSFFDQRTGAQFNPIGFTAVDAYGVVASTPVLPGTVKVGDSGDIASFTVYRDAAKTELVGQRVLSYVVEPDTSAGAAASNTAIVNFVTRGYNRLDILNYTEQSRLRINTVGVLSAVSGDIVYGNGAHLVLTR